MVEINTGARRLPDVNSFRAGTVAFIGSLNDFIRETCEEKMVPVVDLAKALGAPDRPDLLDPRYAIGDNAHLNMDGQKRIAKAFMDDYFNDAEDFNVIVCLGDSHTQGYPVRNETRNGTYLDLEKDSQHQFPYWLAKETGATFINRGIAGNTIYGMKNRFDREVLTHFPDHCLIQGGTNDSLIGTPLEDSKEDLNWIINRCIETGITPVVATILPLGFE